MGYLARDMYIPAVPALPFFFGQNNLGKFYFLTPPNTFSTSGVFFRGGGNLGVGHCSGGHFRKLGQTLFFPWVCYGLYGREVSLSIKNVLFSNVQLAFHRKRGHGGVGKKE